MNSKKTILFICGAKKGYVRNAINLKILKETFNVIEIASNTNSYFIRLPEVILRFLLCFKSYDLVFVGFLGQPLMPFIKLRTKKPIIFDAFISLYDTLCFDRKIFSPNSFIGKFFYWFDKKSCQWADKIITDTDAHANYFSSTFDIDRDKFQAIYVSAEEDLFYPKEIRRDKKYKNKFIVFYYGSVLPLQGVDIILKTAKLLENEENIVFLLVGPIRKKYGNLIKNLNLKNVEFIDWVPYNKLPEQIARADICLGGHFSNIDKAKRVIAGKTFQFIAMKKPVIVGENPANRELFENRRNVLMVEMANADALARAILELKENKHLKEKVTEEGYKIFKEKCTLQQIGKEIKTLIKEILYY